MTDAEIQALAAAVGLVEPLDDVVAWARARTEALMLDGLDPDLSALLAGQPISAHAGVNGEPRYHQSNGQTQRGPAPVPDPIAMQAAASPLRDDDRGSSARLPLPPLPQRPDLAAASGDSADDLEMLDEEDLELVEEMGEDGEEGEGGGTPDVSSPEWKRALADAQGE